MTPTAVEWERMHELREQFWREFGLIVQAKLDQVPEHCRPELEDMLGEVANIASRWIPPPTSSPFAAPLHTLRCTVCGASFRSVSPTARYCWEGIRP